MVLECRQQEGAETAPVALGAGEEIALQHAGKETLREVLSILGTVPQPPNVNVKRIPVSAAKHFERRLRARRSALPRRQHETPVRRAEIARTASGGVQIALGSGRAHDRQSMTRHVVTGQTKAEVNTNEWIVWQLNPPPPTALAPRRAPRLSSSIHPPVAFREARPAARPSPGRVSCPA